MLEATSQDPQTNMKSHKRTVAYVGLKGNVANIYTISALYPYIFPIEPYAYALSPFPSWGFPVSLGEGKHTKCISKLLVSLLAKKMRLVAFRVL